MTVPLAFVDTETTGVHPGRRAWEIAIIRREPDGQEQTLHAFVSDVDLSEADPYGLKIGRFYDRHPKYGRTPEAAAAIAIARDLGLEVPDDGPCLDEGDLAPMVERMARGAHLVGAVPSFDAEVFADMLRRHRLTPAWHYHLIDVENLAAGYLAGIAAATREQIDQAVSTHPAATPPWSSDDLSRAVGVEPAGEDERHTALGDARWAKRVYDAIVGAGSDHPRATEAARA